MRALACAVSIFTFVLILPSLYTDAQAGCSRSLRVVFVDDYVPYQYRDGQGRPVGLDIELFREILRRAAVAGLGIAVMPLFIVKEELADGRLVNLFPELSNEAFIGGVYAVYPHHRHLSAKVRAFVDHLVEHLGGPEQPWDKR